MQPALRREEGIQNIQAHVAKKHAASCSTVDRLATYALGPFEATIYLSYAPHSELSPLRMSQKSQCEACIPDL